VAEFVTSANYSAIWRALNRYAFYRKRMTWIQGKQIAPDGAKMVAGRVDT
jgi:hypothetical protein